MQTKLEKFLETLDVEKFKECFYTMQNKEICQLFDVNVNTFRQAVRYFGLRKDREQLYTIKSQVWASKDWSATVEKRRKTCLARYGVDNQNKTSETKSKIKETKLKRYGDENYHNVEKMKQTNIERYGVQSTFAVEEVKDKIKKTNLAKYGFCNPQQNASIRQKTYQTNFKRYGVKYATQTSNNRLKNNTKEAKLKCNETKRKNKSFNTSSSEITFYNKLCEIFKSTDVYRQYQSSHYPFACDFYIKSLDLYIELNLHWTHGGKPYIESDLWCQKQLQIWKEKADKGSKFYSNAIKTWTIRDVLKLKTASDNNLNIVVLYTDLECLQFLQSLTREQQDDVISRTIHTNM